MYLADVDIRAKLQEMDIVSDDNHSPFDPETQIQPCSIDLRLSNIFWISTNRKPIDLRKARLLELEPRLYWRKRVLDKGETIAIKPGECLYARVCEKFTVPLDCAGKIEGRSSFARMGLGIHLTGDFINPGYRGHMPLQLFNYSNRPIIIMPYIPICQLILIRLSNLPSRKYGQEELQSKYMDDDGGPSYWWRDKRIRSLQERFHEVDLSVRVQEQLLERIGVQEPDVILRFQDYMAKIPHSELDNADAILESFSEHEDKTERRDKIMIGIGYALFPLLASVAIGLLWVKPYILSHYIFWVFTLVSFVPFYRSLYKTPKKFLGTDDLRKFRKNLR